MSYDDTGRNVGKDYCDCKQPTLVMLAKDYYWCRTHKQLQDRDPVRGDAARARQSPRDRGRTKKDAAQQADDATHGGGA